MSYPNTHCYLFVSFSLSFDLMFSLYYFITMSVPPLYKKKKIDYNKIFIVSLSVFFSLHSKWNERVMWDVGHWLNIRSKGTFVLLPWNMEWIHIYFSCHPAFFFFLRKKRNVDQFHSNTVVNTMVKTNIQFSFFFLFLSTPDECQTLVCSQLSLRLNKSIVNCLPCLLVIIIVVDVPHRNVLVKSDNIGYMNVHQPQLVDINRSDAMLHRLSTLVRR